MNIVKFDLIYPISTLLQSLTRLNFCGAGARFLPDFDGRLRALSVTAALGIARALGKIARTGGKIIDIFCILKVRGTQNDLNLVRLEKVLTFPVVS